MGKVLAILGGLIAMAGGVYLVILVWPQKFIDLVFGCIPPMLFFGGLIALIAGISGIKDAARTKKLEAETKEEVKEEPAAEEEKKEEETTE
jgi:ABC-type antimicrobial peptide transport system permease subunit